MAASGCRCDENARKKQQLLLLGNCKFVQATRDGWECCALHPARDWGPGPSRLAQMRLASSAHPGAPWHALQRPNSLQCRFVKLLLPMC